MQNSMNTSQNSTGGIGNPKETPPRRRQRSNPTSHPSTSTNVQQSCSGLPELANQQIHSITTQQQMANTPQNKGQKNTGARRRPTKRQPTKTDPPQSASSAPQGPTMMHQQQAFIDQILRQRQEALTQQQFYFQQQMRTQQMMGQNVVNQQTFAVPYPRFVAPQPVQESQQPMVAQQQIYKRQQELTAQQRLMKHQQDLIAQQIRLSQQQALSQQQMIENQQRMYAQQQKEMDAQQQVASAQQVEGATGNAQPREFNIISLCRLGQETVQDILRRTQEVFQLLQTTDPPNGTTAGADASAMKKQKAQEQLRMIRLLFKRLHLIYDKCVETERAEGLEYAHVESLIPYQDKVDFKSKGGKRTSEACRLAVQERAELQQQMALKNQQLKKLIDHLRCFVCDISTMLEMRKS